MRLTKIESEKQKETYRTSKSKHVQCHSNYTKRYYTRYITYVRCKRRNTSLLTTHDSRFNRVHYFVDTHLSIYLSILRAFIYRTLGIQRYTYGVYCVDNTPRSNLII